MVCQLTEVSVNIISGINSIDYLAEIKFNAADTFIADVVSDLHPPPADGEEDTRNLQFRTILVAPLLEGTEKKFSGYNNAGVNPEDDLGLIVDAFAHSVATHSSQSMVLVDLQGKFCTAGLWHQNKILF